MGKSPNYLQTLPKGAIIGIAILLPCLGFFLGMIYQKDLDGKLNLYPPVPVPTIATTISPTAPQQSTNTCEIDTDCTLYNPQLATKSTLCCHNQNMLCAKNQNQIIAVNKEFLAQQTKNLCNLHMVCPMYMMICPQDIQASINQLHAKCIKKVCQVAHNP